MQGILKQAILPNPKAHPFPTYPNLISDYTQNIFQSELARANGLLSHDVSTVLNGHCFYHRAMVCPEFDHTLIDGLLTDLQSYEQRSQTLNNILHWNNHFKYDDPSFSCVFREICQWLADYFDLEVLATRLNIYTENDYKTYHHDSHAYGSEGKKEDFTVGVSLGATRSLSFLHPPTGVKFDFPQSHGDVFAFDSLVNKSFMHGVPRLAENRHMSGEERGPRLSIICWGKRRTLNPRNCGTLLSQDDVKTKAERAKEDEEDERLFLENNKKYGNYGVNLNESAQESLDIESSTKIYQKSQLLDRKQEREKRVGLPLTEIINLMQDWMFRQEGKFKKLRSADSLEKIRRTNVFSYQSLYPSLLTFYHAQTDICTNSDLNEVVSSEVSRDQWLTGEKGLKIRVGYHNKRFGAIEKDVVGSFTAVYVRPTSVTVTELQLQQSLPISHKIGKNTAKKTMKKSGEIQQASKNSGEKEQKSVESNSQRLENQQHKRQKAENRSNNGTDGNKKGDMNIQNVLNPQNNLDKNKKNSNSTSIDKNEKTGKKRDNTKNPR